MNFDFSKQPGKRKYDRGLVTEGNPRVSIITPFYNAGKYFEQTWNSVLNQTFPWFEWIIIDDGSTDKNSLNVLKELANKDARIKVFHKSNGGVSTARNEGILKSITDIVVPLDADDLLAPTFLEITYWALYFNPEYSWAYTDSVGFQNQEYLWRKDFDIRVLKKHNFLVLTAAIRKKDLIEAGLYDDSEKFAYEDWKLWLRLLEQGKKPVHISTYGFWYRRLEGGVSDTVKKDYIVKKKALEIIEAQARRVSEDIEAKEYPYATPIGTYASIKCSNWNEDETVFQEKRKKKVMFLLPWMVMGGADAFNLDVVRKLDKDRYEISILTTLHGEQSWRQRFEKYVVDIFELPTFLNVENYPEFISYFIKSRKVDIVFLTNSYYGYYVAPWLRMNFPNIVIVDYVHMEEWYWRSGGFARVSGVLNNIIEKTFVCNDKTRKVLIEKFNRNPKSVETLYIGVDKEKFNAFNYEPGLIRKKMKIEEGRPIILFPCRMHPQKRPFLMIEIAKKVKMDIPEIAFLVVGDGVQLNELQQKVKQQHLEHTVYFAGRQNQMQPYYKDSDITLICSLKEGLALTAYESCSMGTPVITSDVGGQAELIDDSVGIVIPLMQEESESLDLREFPDEEINMYVNAIQDLLSDRAEYARKSANCRKRIEERFSTDVMIEKLQERFEELLRDEAYCVERLNVAADMERYSKLIIDRVISYHEIENVEVMYRKEFIASSRSELLRIANSKWGKRIIKWAFKLRLNRLF
ncbi:MAG: glycosyltransferase [Anaeroplasmataceae bacterium]|nr:glycosyltransferase [Anaeroplasmataceae bacterium]